MQNPEAYSELERMAANHSDIYDLPWAHIVQEQLDTIRATDILETSDGGVHVTYVGRKDMLDFARQKAEPRLAFHYGGMNTPTKFRECKFRLSPNSSILTTHHMQNGKGIDRSYNFVFEQSHSSHHEICRHHVLRVEVVQLMHVATPLSIAGRTVCPCH